MVALSHATARELGFAPAPGSEDEKKPFVEVSGRKGLGVKADDLIDRLVQKALFEVTARNAEMPPADAERVARQIAVAAVRYFLVKFSRGKIIAFDLDEALSFEGESGPYIQYTVVRARNVLQTVQERLGLTEAALPTALPATPAAELDGANGSHEVWALILEAARLDDVVEQVIRTLEFSMLAKYAFSLAQSFNALLPSGAHRQRGTRRCPPVARRGRGVRPGSADARAGPDGHRDSRPDVGRPRRGPRSLGPPSSSP